MTKLLIDLKFKSQLDYKLNSLDLNFKSFLKFCHFNKSLELREYPLDRERLGQALGMCASLAVV